MFLLSLCNFSAAPYPTLEESPLLLSSPLRQLCGWPSVHTGGLFGNATVRLAQRLLGHALGEPHTRVDGVFSAATTQSIERFQTASGLNGSAGVTLGYLNAGTWPLLVEDAAHTPLSRSPQLVLAAQDALTANGFPTPLSGTLDLRTQQMLAKLRQERGPAHLSPPHPAGTVDAGTWHLLATGCNASRVTGGFWFDAGWPQGNMSQDVLSCLHSRGMEFATFECWVEQSHATAEAHAHSGSFWPGCVGNIARAHAAGFDQVGVYMFPGRHGDPTAQARWLLGNLSAHRVGFHSVMLDVEGNDWLQYNAAANVAFMLAMKRVFDSVSVKVLMYAGREWPAYFGQNFTAFSDVPLIYAHYDLVPSFYDFPRNGYGGWKTPAGKQFWDGQQGEKICGTGPLDWDWSSEPFWMH